MICNYKEIKLENCFMNKESNVKIIINNCLYMIDFYI